MKENIDKIVFIQEPMHFVFCSSASDRILRSYKRSLNGFAAKLSKEETQTVWYVTINMLFFSIVFFCDCAMRFETYVTRA